MDLEGVGQEDVMCLIWGWWVRRMSYDGFEVVCMSCDGFMSCDGLEVEAEGADSWI